MDLTFGQFLLFFGLMLALIAGLALTIIALAERSRRKKHASLPCLTQGVYEKEVSVGSDPYFPAFYVFYQVDGIRYHLTERIQYREDPAGGRNRFGQIRMVPVIGDVHPGDTVTVQYDPDRPRRAVIYGNVKATENR